MPTHERYLKHMEYYRDYNRKHPEKNTERKKKYQHEYRLKNRDKIRASGREYRLKNREKEMARHHDYSLKNKERRSEYGRKYRKEHPRKYTEAQKARRRDRYWKDPDKMRKLSRDWASKHPEKARSWASRWYHNNPERGKITRKEYYKKHPEVTRESWRRSKAGRTEFVNDIKRGLRCSMCGQSFPDFPSIIDFHHAGKEPKSEGVAILMGHVKSEKAILAEIAKCMPLCANCHRMLHSDERKKQKSSPTVPSAWRKQNIKRVQLVDAIKRKQRCSVCGQSFPDCPSVIDLHHADKESKLKGVGQLVGHNASEKAILAEIAKCTPLCANCHRKLHDLEKQEKKRNPRELSSAT